jgi:hypothetical protein
MHALSEGRYDYIRNGDGTEELYDFLNDPVAERNLVNEVGRSTILERFRATLSRTLESDRGGHAQRKPALAAADGSRESR